MNSTTEQSQIIIPIGYGYYLTVTSNTSVMEGWCCGFTAKNGVDDREQTLQLGFSTISCSANTNLSITQNTTMIDGYLCGMGFMNISDVEQTSNTKKNAAASLAPRWVQLFVFLSVFLHLFA
ncbi:LAQU0S17e02234g1_1 [Lachancea quebecensis]|uniref:LAQU0S17e02234g1_1 n=1 Tax=Lachancea quebecensis TaxID=1654605 RepID=A0A0P1KWZ2_9SACH|nr:LAQU0S17e02234g1_1 [Lachancea quebecensis]